MPSLPPGGAPDPDSERLFLHAMLDSSPDHIYFKDTQSRFLCISRALARYFGLADPSEALGKTDFDFHSPEKAEIRFEDERRIMETHTPIVDKVERQTAREDGHPIWVLTSKSPLCDCQGRLVGTFGISRDITMLKTMEDALGSERNLLRTVIDNVPDFIFAKDADGRYTLNNEAHIRFLGKSSPEDVEGKTVFDLFPPESAKAAHADDRIVMESGQPVLDRLESPAPGRWLLTSKIPVFDVHGTVTGLVAISRDITEQKQAQEQLEKANADLRQSREKLLHALEELRAVQLQLVEAEKMKLVGRLAAGVAHEVKNPLAIIGMGLDYLNGQKFDDPNVPVVLAEIGNAVQRADRVVRELLDFSAPKKMGRAPEDVNRIVRNALVLARGDLGARKIAVVEELTSDLPLVRLDAMKIEQALVNLFSNAAQAMGAGGRLTVRTGCRQVTGIGENVAHSGRFLPGARVVAIEILDTGTGIPEADLGRVFEPFFTTKPTGKGTGLGLTVTKTIIDLHGGEIEIGNRPEGGACVTLLFNAETH
ncbi:MAG: PAS domain-containing protein [Chthoniobacteraceae bacterium]|nr:PAS domain-containing protein [Chthoniobacteraceae bacterium]